MHCIYASPTPKSLLTSASISNQLWITSILGFTMYRYLLRTATETTSTAWTQSCAQSNKLSIWLAWVHLQLCIVHKAGILLLYLWQQRLSVWSERWRHRPSELPALQKQGGHERFWAIEATIHSTGPHLAAAEPACLPYWLKWIAGLGSRSIRVAAAAPRATNKTLHHEQYSIKQLLASFIGVFLPLVMPLSNASFSFFSCKYVYVAQRSSFCIFQNKKILLLWSGTVSDFVCCGC